MEDGAETPRSAATFISEILPMMGTVTEPEQYSASNGLGVEINNLQTPLFYGAKTLYMRVITRSYLREENDGLCCCVAFYSGSGNTTLNSIIVIAEHS